MIAGIDYSTRAVDVVLLDEDSDAAAWHRFELHGQDAFDRARSVYMVVPLAGAVFWDEVVAIGIEDPRGYGAGSLYRVQGAILSCIPRSRLVHPLIPSHWRKTVGLPGNASKGHVQVFAEGRRYAEVAQIDERGLRIVSALPEWPQDACDAFCIALATRTLLEHKDAA